MSQRVFDRLRIEPGDRVADPLFTSALDRFAEHQPEPDDIASAMRDAGLDVMLDHDTFTVRVNAGH